MSLQFNGTSDYLKRNARIITTYPFSAFVWVWSDEVYAQDTGEWTIFTQYYSGTEWFHLRLDDGAGAVGKLQAGARDGGGFKGNMTTGNSIPGSAWASCALSRASGDHKLILDGDTGNMATSSETTVSLANHSEFHIGRFPSTDYWIGHQAYLTLWDNLALTQDEMVALNDGRHPMTMHPDKIAACYPFEYHGISKGHDLTGTHGIDTSSGTTLNLQGPPIEVWSPTRVAVWFPGDEPSSEITKVVDETVSVAEAKNLTMALTRLVNETESVAETVLDLRALTRIVSETEGVSESVVDSRALTRVVDETEGITESVVDVLTAVGSEITKVVDEVVAVNETALGLLALTRVVDETEAVSEATSRVLALTRIVSEAEAIAESVLDIRGMVRVVSETESVAEASVATRALTRVVTEVEAIAGSSLHVLGGVITKVVTDVVAINEATTKKVALEVGVYEALSNTVNARFEAVVEDAIPIPTLYGNRARTKTGATVPDDAAWIDFECKHIETELLTVGSHNTFRMHGEACSRISIPLEIGDASGRTIAKTITEAYRHTTVDGTTYRTPFQRAPRREDSRYVIELVVPFYADFSEGKVIGSSPTSTLDPVTVGNAIRAHFHNQIGSALSVPVQYDNAPLAQPADSIWCRWSIVEGQGETVEGGSSKLMRTPGQAVAQVFTPLGVGESSALELADSVTAVFRGTEIDGILFGTPQVRTIGRHRGDRWWQINAVCPFHYETST